MMHLHKTCTKVVHMTVPFGQALEGPVHIPGEGQPSCLCSALFVLWSSSETALRSAKWRKKLCLVSYGLQKNVTEKKRSLVCIQQQQQHQSLQIRLNAEI
ncbi:hypothetical protein AMECASPLE_032981 [Ameca splendens]|uniref:Uncharacterized protein n=1 Tax=Ameca splendens TaxID=208324 RepID=A0ABV0XW07_9TELE